MNVNQSKLRLRKWQSLTNKQLDEIVRYEVEYLFLKKTIKDQRMPELLERIIAKQLKEEVRILFFESLAELLEGVGIGINATPYITWHNTRDKLREYDDSPENKVNVRMYYIHFYNKDNHHHSTCLHQKILDIVEFVIKKHIFEPMLEEVRYKKPKTLAERTHDRGNGKRFIEIDTCNYVKYIGQSIARELKWEEANIRTAWTN